MSEHRIPNTAICGDCEHTWSVHQAGDRGVECGCGCPTFCYLPQPHVDLDWLSMEILAFLEDQGNSYTATPGRLIADLATEMFVVEVKATARDRRYCATALVLRKLEALGFLEIQREDSDHPERGNKLTHVALTL